MDLQAAILDMGRRARAASHELVKLSTEQKNRILRAMAGQLRVDEAEILRASIFVILISLASMKNGCLVSLCTIGMAISWCMLRWDF